MKFAGLLALTVALCPLAARAQSDGGPPEVDASLPDLEGVDASVTDASVGEGGADTSQEKDDSVGRVTLVCKNSGDCNRGFACKAGRCTYIGYRRADNGGCILGIDAALFAVGFALVVRRNAKRPR
jgi:hypothetical protein